MARDHNHKTAKDRIQGPEPSVGDFPGSNYNKILKSRQGLDFNRRAKSQALRDRPIESSQPSALRRVFGSRGELSSRIDERRIPVRAEPVAVPVDHLSSNLNQLRAHIESERKIDQLVSNRSHPTPAQEYDRLDALESKIITKLSNCRIHSARAPHRNKHKSTIANFTKKNQFRSLDNRSKTTVRNFSSEGLEQSLKETEYQVNATEEKIQQFLQDLKPAIFKSNTQSLPPDMDMYGGLQSRYQYVKPTKIKRFRRGMPIEDALAESPLQGPGYFLKKDSKDIIFDISVEKIIRPESNSKYSTSK